MTDSRRPVPSQQMRPNQPQPPSADELDGERWVDLREAEELTGIPGSTIRNWARKGRIDSRFEMDESGDRRYVELSEVLAWAEHLGRQHKRVVRGVARPAGSPADPSPSGSRDLTEDRAASEEVAADRAAEEVRDAAIGDSPPAEGAEAAEFEPPDEPDGTRDDVSTARTEIAIEEAEDEDRAARDIPEGTMLVPLDAWNKMLNQLGNLHEAGQQLADARERAARAETEVQFLRERLAELRERSGTEAAADPSPPEDVMDPLWVDLYRRWKRRRP